MGGDVMSGGVTEDRVREVLNTIVDPSGDTQVRFYQVNMTLISLADNRKVWVGQKDIRKLVTRSKRLCGNAFRSVCDADLTPIIAKEAANKTAPRFIYWLTLNTHVPVAPGDALTNFGCASNAA